MLSQTSSRNQRSDGRPERAPDVVLFGNGAVAQALYVELSTEACFNVVGFTVDREYIKEDSLLGLPVVPFDQVAKHYPPDRHRMIVALGFVHVNKLRAERCATAKNMGYQLLSHVSPLATTWPDLVIGENCIISHNCIINPFVTLGDNVYLGAGSIIGHHAVIKDHCFVAGGVVIAGGVTVGPYSFLGTGSTIRNRVIIASRNVIGAGAIILENTKNNGVYMADAAVELPISSDKLNL